MSDKMAMPKLRKASNKAQRRKAWASLLESDMYKQVTGRLRGKEINILDEVVVEDGFCCLGVACDLYGKVMGVEWEKNGIGQWSFMGSVGALPEAVADWYGLYDEDPCLEVDVLKEIDRDEDGEFDTPECLSSLNDDHNLNFKQIAQGIRKSKSITGSNDIR
jgi:hypothetical protein